MVTIGDSPPSSLSSLVYLVPLLYYSHIAHSLHTHHNLLLPFLSVERDKNSTSHLCRGVQFRVSLMVKEYFHSACRGAIFLHPSQQAQASFSLPCPGGSVQGWLWVDVVLEVLEIENGIAIKAVELEEQKAGQWVCCNLYMHPYNQ